jgi:ATP-dependent Clp protease ATP-binding subunit ClpC
MDGFPHPLDAFTEPGRQVVALARDEAGLLYHDYLGSEHLLLGILREGDSAAARVLDAAGVSLTGARDELKAIIGRGRSAPTGTVTPLTPRAKNLLGVGAPATGTGRIGPEHILLRLVHERHGVGAEILTRCGVDLDEVEQRLHGLTSR